MLPFRGLADLRDTRVILRARDQASSSAAKRMALACPRRSETTFTGTPSAGSRVGGQHLADEAAGEPLRMPVAAVEVAQHDRRVLHEVYGQQPTDCPIGAERGDGARVQIHDPGLARLRPALDQLLAGAFGLHHADAAAYREPTGIQVDGGDPPAGGGRRGARRRAGRVRGVPRGSLRGAVPCGEQTRADAVVVGAPTGGTPIEGIARLAARTRGTVADHRRPVAAVRDEARSWLAVAPPRLALPGTR